MNDKYKIAKGGRRLRYKRNARLNITEDIESVPMTTQQSLSDVYKAQNVGHDIKYSRAPWPTFWLGGSRVWTSN